MRNAWSGICALIRVSWLTASSYRVGMAIAIASLLATVVPLYFIAGALQPALANSITDEGGHYFSFLLVGIVALSFLAQAVTALPSALSSTIASGTLEALIGTRARLATLLSGLVGYGFIWAGVRAIVLLTAGWALGMNAVWAQAPAAALIMTLIILAYLSFGFMAAAMVLAFRTSGPLPRAVLVVSALLGGVYYPTHIIPSWVELLSAAVPLTYGLRALRRVLLEGSGIWSVRADLTVLSALAATLLLLGLLMFSAALRHSRRVGTLAQY